MLKNNVIGEKIKNARLLRGIPQQKFAEELGIAASAVAAYESGKRVPKIELREQMARVLMIDPLELAGLDLTEDDERRILNKLLMKYSKNIVKNEDGTVSAVFDEDYGNLQEIYERLHTFEIDSYIGFDIDNPIKIDILPAAHKEELAEFWLESWPIFDYLQVLKRCLPESKQDNEEFKKRLIDVTQQNMNAIFYSKSEEQFRKYIEDFKKSCKVKQQVDKSSNS